MLISGVHPPNVNVEAKDHRFFPAVDLKQVDLDSICFFCEDCVGHWHFYIKNEFMSFDKRGFSCKWQMTIFCMILNVGSVAKTNLMTF
jgi:hypothetical protein